MYKKIKQKRRYNDKKQKKRKWMNENYKKK